MAWDDIGAGIAGGIDGLLRTLSWEREQDQQDRLINEREGARRDQNNARGLDLMFRERGRLDELEATSFEREQTAKRQKIFDDWYATLPTSMKNVIRAKQAGASTDVGDWEDPAAKALREADTRAQKYLDEELKHTRTMEAEGARRKGNLDDDIRLEGIRHGYRMKEKSDLAVVPKDDAALPAGVKGYLSSLLTKHRGDFAAAESEWNRGFAEQQSKHPQLDPDKARKYLENVFGYQQPRPLSDVLQELVDGPPAPFRARGFEQPKMSPTPGETLDPADAYARARGTQPRMEDIVLGDANALRAEEARGSLEYELGLRARAAADRPRDRVDAQQELTNGTGRPTAQPIEVVEPPSDDPPQERSPEARADQLQRLSSQVKSLMQQINAGTTPAQRNALRRQLKPVLEQYQRAGGK